MAATPTAPVSPTVLAAAFAGNAQALAAAAQLKAALMTLAQADLAARKAL